MLTSGGVLVVFLVSWLLTQYKSADRQLQKDVRADLRKTSDQLVDSMMIQFFTITSTQPLTTSATLSVPENEQIGGTITQSATEIKIVVNNDSSPKKIIRQDVTRNSPVKRIQLKHPRHIHQPLIVLEDGKKQSVDDSVLTQLFTEGAGAIAKQLSTFQKSSNILTLTNQPLDTALCRKLLRKNWQNNQLDYRLIFNAKSSDKTLIYPENPLFGTQFGVELHNRGSVAFAAILPDFFFALFLMLITLVAFVLVYRSYLRQLQINTLRTDFVNNISHELKTPVSTVRVALDALQNYNRKNDPQVRDEYLQLMSLEIDRLDRLIHQVLQHGRLESAENHLQLAPVDLDRLVAEVVERYRLKAEEKGAKIRYDQPLTRMEITADSEHLGAVIGNLIENALLYAGKHPEITITLKRNGKQIVLEVLDNGPGIPPEYHAQLFKPFFRVPTGNSHNVKGYGLGLSYCKQIVEQHGGTISVQNVSASGGCLFRMIFNG